MRLSKQTFGVLPFGVRVYEKAEGGRRGERERKKKKTVAKLKPVPAPVSTQPGSTRTGGEAIGSQTRRVAAMGFSTATEKA